MIMKLKTLNEWALEHPTVNPFTGCLNVETYGGATLLYNELLYRYGEREIFKENQFVAEIERLFVINSYKYNRLYQTTVQAYDIFSNYKVQKAGSEVTNTTLNKSGTENSTRTPAITETTTPNLSHSETITPAVTETETFTPTVKSQEVTTPTLKTKETVTPTTKTKETDTAGVSTTTTSTPDSYTDTTSRSTYDDATYKPVEFKTHTGTAGGTTIVTPNGHNEKLTEVVSGNTITENEVVSGNTTVTKETISGNNVTQKVQSGHTTKQGSQTGTNTKQTTGTDTTAITTSGSNTGSETLTFNGRIDSGYMYREPQNAIRDERDIALFSLVNDILKDVEDATLLSIYI